MTESRNMLSDFIELNDEVHALYEVIDHLMELLGTNLVITKRSEDLSQTYQTFVEFHGETITTTRRA